MLEASTNTMEEDEALKKLVSAAAGVVTGSQNIIGVRKAMQYVGFSEEQCKSMRLYQQVRRKAQKLAVVDLEKKQTSPPAEEVNVGRPASSTSSLTIDSQNTSRRTEGRSTRSSQDSVSTDEANSPISSVREHLQNEGDEQTVDGDSNGNEKKKEKVTRRSSNEVQRHNAAKARAKDANKKAMKAATILIKRNLDLPKKHPEKKSIDQIVKATNQRYNSTITSKSAGRYVRRGMIGQSPLKKGPIGDFPKPVYNALKGAYSTYLKLEQAESKKQSGLKQMTKLVNKVVNAAGFNKTRDDLTKKLRRDTANEFEVGKANVTEYRRVQWTTAYNLEVWFSTWKDLLIQLGFARASLTAARRSA